MLAAWLPQLKFNCAALLCNGLCASVVSVKPNCNAIWRLPSTLSSCPGVAGRGGLFAHATLLSYTSTYMYTQPRTLRSLRKRELRVKCVRVKFETWGNPPVKRRSLSVSLCTNCNWKCKAVRAITCLIRTEQPKYVGDLGWNDNYVISGKFHRRSHNVTNEGFKWNEMMGEEALL